MTRRRRRRDDATGALERSASESEFFLATYVWLCPCGRATIAGGRTSHICTIVDLHHADCLGRTARVLGLLRSTWSERPAAFARWRTVDLALHLHST